MGKPLINDAVWQKIRKRMDVLKAEGPHVKIGVFQSAGTEPGGDISLVELAAIHEFGSPAANIPERSFLRSTFSEGDKKKALVAVTKKLAKKLITGKITTDRALDVLGQWGVAAVKSNITTGDGIPPPNAEGTIRKKKSSRPLVEHGHLLNSITYQKVDGSGGGTESAPADVSEPSGDGE